jgi:nitroreductase
MLTKQMLRRLSIRKYEQDSLSQDTLNVIRDIINNQHPLIGHNNYQIDLVENGKSFQKVLGGIIGSYGKIHSPHYLVASVEMGANGYENIGYMVENIVLKLTEMNLGTCWIGGGVKEGLFKDFLQLDKKLTPIVVIAFGKPLNNDFRNSVNEFKRKSLQDIVIGEIPEQFIPIMDLVRIAPSAVNFQPWRFVFENDSIHVYRVKQHFLMKKLVGDMNKIDVGIALSHLEIALKEYNISYSVKISNNDTNNMFYVCSFKLS